MDNQLEVIKKTSILIEEKKYFQAKEILSNFIHNAKNIKIDIKVFYNLYLVSNGLNELKNAKKFLEKCLKVNDENHIILNNLGNIFFREGNIPKAEKLYNKSFQLKNDYLIVIINLAILNQNIGKLDEAKKFYLKAIELAPHKISLYYNISKIDKNFIDKNRVKFLLNILKNENLDMGEKAYGYFILADYERKNKEFIKEIEFLKKGNDFLFNSKKKINSITLDYWINILPKKYNKFVFSDDEKKNELKNLKPIFIIGLPRSGSTITEVLLSTGDKKITSFGEINIFNGIISNGFSNNKEFQINLNFVRNKILNFFDEKNYKVKGCFIDKSLENFFYIDVIMKIFPNAKFINTFRNIEDNIFAIFSLLLDKLSWTHSLDSIIKYVDNYLKIINYFQKKYPKNILRVNLEELTNNPTKISQELYSFCDLKWSDEILNFNQRKDLLISTASNIQIREKIEKYNHEKYRSYKSLLKKYLKSYQWLNQK